MKAKQIIVSLYTLAYHSLNIHMGQLIDSMQGCFDHHLHTDLSIPCIDDEVSTNSIRSAAEVQYRLRQQANAQHIVSQKPSNHLNLLYHCVNNATTTLTNEKDHRWSKDHQEFAQEEEKETFLQST